MLKSVADSEWFRLWPGFDRGHKLSMAMGGLVSSERSISNMSLYEKTLVSLQILWCSSSSSVAAKVMRSLSESSVAWNWIRAVAFDDV